MSTDVPRRLREVAYERFAQEYLYSLPPEHFMEATAQARQREITMASLAVIKLQRPVLQYFNELLIQYPVRGQRRPGQVVPDNMIVISDQPVRATSSYNVPLEPAPPFMVMEYVSQGNQRKDYEDSFQKYERDLKVPYYLVFYPDGQELTLYRHNKRKYVTVRPNQHGRYAIPELDLEVALLDGWVRYWYQGELVPLPEELQRKLNEVKVQVEGQKRQIEEQKRRIEEEKRRAEEQTRKAEEQKRRADHLQEQLKAAERELARLRRQHGER
jgi:hypothetical protein